MIVSLVTWKNPYIPAVMKILGEEIVECYNRQEALNTLPKAEIVITMGGGFDEEMLEASKNLRLLLSLSAGIEKLPLDKLHQKGVAVCNTKGAHGTSISEFVLGGMLSMAHSFPTFIRNQEKTIWQPVFHINDLQGQTLCIVGAGSIGSEIGKKAKAFDMTVIGLKRNPEVLACFDEVWGIDRLHEALGKADYVVMITPLTAETYHLMGAEEFRAMKDTAVFINVSRGNTVDEDALVQALLEKQIAGAVLDVFRKEPLQQDSPLWTMKNVMVTPHNSGFTNNTLTKTVQLICENILRYRKGQELLNQIKGKQTY